MSPSFYRHVAFLLKVHVADLDMKRLDAAIHAVQHKTEEYWDALTEFSQLHENLDFASCVALVYG